MFIISQYLLNNLSTFTDDVDRKQGRSKLENTSIYAIGIGLVVYACIYLYFLFYNEEFLPIFNKFIIYILGIDLLLSSFYYSNNKNSLECNQIENSDNFSDDI
jgi:putative flippase GtrA